MSVHKSQYTGVQLSCISVLLVRLCSQTAFANRSCSRAFACVCKARLPPPRADPFANVHERSRTFANTLLIQVMAPAMPALATPRPPSFYSCSASACIAVSRLAGPMPLHCPSRGYRPWRRCSLHPPPCPCHPPAPGSTPTPLVTYGEVPTTAHRRSEYAASPWVSWPAQPSFSWE